MTASNLQDDIIQMQKKAISSLREENERAHTYRRCLAAQLHVHRIFVATIRQCTDIFIVDEIEILWEALDKCPKAPI